MKFWKLNFSKIGMCVVTLSVIVNSIAWSQSQSNTKKKKPSTPAENITENSTSDSELDELSANENALNSLQSGKWSMAIDFPTSGTQFGVPGIGLRYMLNSSTGVMPLLQISHDKASKKTAVGFTLRGQHFFTPSARISSYTFLQATLGQNSGDGFKTADAPKDATDIQAGTALGLGAELFLIREFSVSGELGIGYGFLPSRKTTLNTSVSQLAAHYHFGF